MVTQCERGDSDPHAPFGTPDPKSRPSPAETPNNGQTATDIHAETAPNRTVPHAACTTTCDTTFVTGEKKDAALPVDAPDLLRPLPAFPCREPDAQPHRGRPADHT